MSDKGDCSLRIRIPGGCFIPSINLQSPPRLPRLRRGRRGAPFALRSFRVRVLLLVLDPRRSSSSSCALWKKDGEFPSSARAAIKRHTAKPSVRPGRPSVHPPSLRLASCYDIELGSLGV